MNLNEWKDSNGNKINLSSSPGNTKASSTSYKKRFEKLIKYHIDHASSELESITKKDIRDNYFHLGEHYNTGRTEFDRDVVASYDENSGTFFFRILVDGKEVESVLRQSYDKFVKAIEAYMFLPDWNTPEYNELLTEWVDSNGKKVSLSNSSSNTSSNKTSAKNYPDQTDRYKRLLAQIDADKTCKYIVNLLDDRILAITINSAKGDLGFKIIFKPYVPCYLLQLTTKESVKELSREDFEEVLDLLLDAGLINNTDLCESISSIADDFKTYENLWD